MLENPHAPKCWKYLDIMLFSLLSTEEIIIHRTTKEFSGGFFHQHSDINLHRDQDLQLYDTIQSYWRDLWEKIHPNVECDRNIMVSFMYLLKRTPDRCTCIRAVSANVHLHGDRFIAGR